MNEEFLHVFKGAPLRGPPATDRPSGRACGLCGPISARTGQPPMLGGETAEVVQMRITDQARCAPTVRTEAWRAQRR